jgi:hypothetical protein
LQRVGDALAHALVRGVVACQGHVETAGRGVATKRRSAVAAFSILDSCGVLDVDAVM